MNILGKKNFILKITCDKDEFLVREGNQWEKQISVRPVNIILNDKEGQGIIEYLSTYTGHCPVPVQHSFPLLREPGDYHTVVQIHIGIENEVWIVWF